MSASAATRAKTSPKTATVAARKVPPARRPTKAKVTAAKRRDVAGIDDRVPPLLLRVDDVAKALALGTRQVWELVYRGDRDPGDPAGLRAVRIGRSRRVPTWEVLRYARHLAGEVDTIPDVPAAGHVAGVWSPHLAATTSAGRAEG